MRANSFDGLCAACAQHVLAGSGRLTGRPGAWRTWCIACSPSAPARGAHRGWHDVTLASLDFETTGVDPRHDRVISYALLDEPGFEITGLIHPGIPVPPASAAVHGISDAMLADAPPADVEIAVVAEWVQSLVERQVGLVVFNAAYDLTMLQAECRRHDVAEPEWDRLLVVDPFVVDWGLTRGELGQRRLVDVAAYYEVGIDNAHDASCDARAARDVAVEQAARHEHVGTATLSDLMAHQRRWYAERAEDWNAYARRVGRDLDDPTGWPLAA
ncbi:hypothetical protein ASD11_01030 [Aeromicrobium sp. Root495]|uniref:exonuclease domain-containing protein n=1 Tax=Aeromicrobium sp. Root495 TaxID=1736550 RepID=UPI0006FB640B|nr:exonuclease domain-containing protein [Aeromicrobium sp. Root495]KQY58281.1 hypothetical protein ASD11_01030 [Aeromicrobium sp. Root495]